MLPGVAIQSDSIEESRVGSALFWNGKTRVIERWPIVSSGYITCAHVSESAKLCSSPVPCAPSDVSAEAIWTPS